MAAAIAAPISAVPTRLVPSLKMSPVRRPGIDHRAHRVIDRIRSAAASPKA